MQIAQTSGGGTIIEDIISKNIVALIGLPCNIASVLTMLRNRNIDTSNLVTIDLVCGGTTPAEVGAQYITYLEKKYHSKVTEFSVRYKNPDWTPPYLRAVFENGSVFCRPFYDTEYGYAFELMKRDACYSCQFKGKNHVSDITIGDGWGIKEGEPSYNAAGVSVAFVHTAKGDTLLKGLRNFVLFEADWDRMEKANPRYSTPKPHSPKSETYRSHYQKYGLFGAYKKVCGLKLRLVKFLPDGMVQLLRKTKHFMERKS